MVFTGQVLARSHVVKCKENIHCMVGIMTISSTCKRGNPTTAFKLLNNQMLHHPITQKQDIRQGYFRKEGASHSLQGIIGR